MAALDRALALAEGEHAALGVAEHLDLDVPGRHERALEVERAVAERRLGLARSRRRRRPRAPSGEVTTRMPLPPPPAVAFSSTGKPSSAAAILISARLATPSVPGTSGTPAARISAFARALSPVFSITSAGGPMKTRSLSVAGAHEGRVLGEEAEARVDRLAAGRLGGGDDVRDPEVAVRGRRRADADRLVGHPDVQRLALGRRVDGHRLDAELVQRADHADRDLTPVRDEDAGEHR